MINNNNKHWFILFFIAFGTIFISVNTTMIALALKPISVDFNSTILLTSWVVTIYLLIMAAFQSIAGKLGDIYGSKKIFLFGMFLFLVGSVLASISTSLLFLIITRALQAIGGVLSIPNASSILRYVTNEKNKGKVFGLFASTTGIGAALGPFLGGFLIERFGWSSIFLIGVPFIIISIIFVFLLVPEIKSKHQPKMDIMGSILFSTFIILVVLVSKQEIEFTLLNVLVIIITFVLFIKIETKIKEPLIQLEFFKRSSFTLANILIFILNFFMFTTILLMPIFFVEIANKSIEFSGFLLTLFFGTFTIMSSISGYLSEKIRKKTLIISSFSILTVSALLFGQIENFQTDIFFVFILIFTGIGVGLGFPMLQLLNIQSVTQKETGVAQGMYQTFRYLGAVVASIIIAIYPTDIIVFKVVFVVVCFGLVLTFFINKRE